MKILIDGQTLQTPDINRGIGTYFKNIINNMLTFDFSNEFFITTSDIKSLSHLDTWVSNKLTVIENKNFDPNLIYQAETQKFYSETLNQEIKKHSIDLFWTPNPLMTNVFLPEKNSKCIFSATIFDLIPIVMQDDFLNKWPLNIKNYYLEKLRILPTNYDCLFHISNHTKKDFIEQTKNYRGNNIITYLAADNRFKPSPFPKPAVNEPYILYLGGFDARKNMFNAIEAFSILHKKYKKTMDISSLKLYITCSIDENQKKLLTDFSISKNIKDKIVFTGFVDERNLPSLYQHANALFYPSLYEGFGLPVLEGLASGLPVACSKNSSLPEVGGDQVIYFNANDPNDISKSLFNVLNEPTDIKSRQQRYLYSQNFCWRKTAQETLLAMEQCQNRQLILKQNKPKIAWLSPFPPQKSGIANYSKLLLRYLIKFADIELFYDNILPDKSLTDDFTCYPMEKFVEKRNQYDEVFYHIGNSPTYHTNIYKIAWKYPGTVVLHDYNISAFLEHAFHRTDEKEYFYDALSEGYGLKKSYILSKTKFGLDSEFWKYSMSDALVKRSNRVIVHHQWVKNQILENNHIDVIPHFSYLPSTPSKYDINNFKKKYKLKNYYVLSILGFINWNKLPLLAMKATKLLLDQGFPVKLLFAGEISPDVSDIPTQTKELGIENNVVTTGYLKDKDYYLSLFSSDIVINLRNPSMGEASGTLLQALAANKITIVSNQNQYREFPDCICLKLDHNENEVSNLVSIIKNILLNPTKREEIQKNIKNYINIFSLDLIAKRYLSHDKLINDK